MAQAAKLGIGLVGFGRMGRIRAAVVEETGRARLLGVHDPAAEDIGALPRARSMDELLENPEVSALFVCTPNCYNQPFTIAALRAGKHVFCEKPPAFDAREMEAVRAVEAESGRKLMYGFNHRHHSSIKHMRQLIRSGEYGEVLWLRGRYGKSVDDSFFESWRAKREFAGGGILIDQGIHMVDLFLHLGGEFDSIQSVVSNRYWKVPVEDNVFAILTNTRTGVVASLHSTMTQWRHLFSLEVFLSRGYMVLNGLRTSSKTYGDEMLCVAKNRSRAPAATFADEERITYETDMSWRSEVDHFLDAIALDTPIALGHSRDALELMRTIDAIYANSILPPPAAAASPEGPR